MMMPASQRPQSSSQMAPVVEARDASLLLVQSDSSEMFACEICSKTFSKRASRNRHRLYCRKKSALGEPHRKKPCVACRRAKIKCNVAFPCCGRCSEKKVDCVYDRKTLNAPLVHIQANESIGLLELDVSDPLLSSECGYWEPELDGGMSDGKFHEASLNDTVAHNQALVYMPSNLESCGNEGSSDNWDFESMESSYPPITESTISIDGTSLTNSSPASDNDDSTFRCTLAYSGTDIGNDIMLDGYSFDTNFSLSSAFPLGAKDPALSGNFFDSPYLNLTYITSLHHSTSRYSAVARRRTPFILSSRSVGSQIGQGFVLQNIRSYASTMLEAIAAPPFIHRSSLAETDCHLDSGLSHPESLVVCQSIVQMHATKTKPTSPFLWRTVAAEQKRLVEMCQAVDEWNTLAMLQATTIYILLRIFSEDSFSIEFDNDLVQTMTTIAIRSEESGFLSTSEVLGERPSWSEWILMESKRRTVTLLFIIHLLFDINPGQRAKALSGLSQLPLPAYKSIWQASTESTWASQYHSWLQEREGRPALSYGDMLYLSQSGHSIDEDPRVKDLNAWYVNVDAFGILVMMAATSLSI